MCKTICMVNIDGAKALFERPTGGTKRFWELYSFFLSSGYNVDVYCGCTEEELNEHNIKGYSLNINEFTKGLFSAPSLSVYKNNKDIFKQIKDKNYDCIITFDVPATTTVCLAKIKNINYFIRQDLIKYRKIQYEELQMSKAAIFIRLFAGWRLEGICIRRSDRIISQCQVDIDSIMKRHPFLRRKIKQQSLIQINNINPSWMEGYNATKDIEKKYDVGFVGNFDDDRKGAHILLEALNILYKQGLKYTAVMVGGGKNLEEYKKNYADLSSINFVGHINNPMDYIKSMKLMVVPSRSDSCPNTIMEALFVGTSVIGANCGGIPEILTNSDWLFELDRNSLSKKIEEILENNSVEKLSSDQSFRAKELTFNWGKAIEKCLVFK